MHRTNLAGLDLNQLVVLHALLQERHVTRAAARLGLSQPATSHALARLRERFGDPLLVRTRAGLEPTARARELAALLTSVVEGAERLLAAPVAFDPRSATGAFRLATAESMALQLIPPLLRQLATTAPLVDVDVESPTEDDADRLARDELHVAIVVLPGRISQLNGIYQRKLQDEEFVCAVRRGHPLGKRLTLKRFLELGHVVTGIGRRGNASVDLALAKLKLKRRIALRLPSFLAGCHVVASSDLVMTLPRRTAEYAANQLDLTLHPPPLQLDPFSLYAVWHERQHREPQQVWLREQLFTAAEAAVG